MDVIWLFLSVDVAFAYHFVATSLIFTLPPYGSANCIGYTSKKLSRMAGNSASYIYTFNRQTTNSYRIVASFMQASVFLPKLQYFK